MTARPPKEVLGLHLPFGEALEAFIAADPKETRANIAKSKKKKPLGGRKAKPSGKRKGKNVISLRDRKTALGRQGRA
jgi:hypothetical protein